MVVIEIAIFTDMYGSVIWECMYLWLAYYSFMTCTRILVYFYSLILFIACGMNAMNVFIFIKAAQILPTLGFFYQLSLYGFGGYYVFWRMRAWANADPKKDLGQDEDIEKTPTPNGKSKEKSMEDKVAAETGKHLANGLMKAAEKKSGALLTNLEKKI